MEIGSFRVRLYYREQQRPAVKCGKCLQEGHVAALCNNEIVCIVCRQPGHKQGDPTCDLGSHMEKESGSVESGGDGEDGKMVEEEGADHEDQENEDEVERQIAAGISSLRDAPKATGEETETPRSTSRERKSSLPTKGKKGMKTTPQKGKPAAQPKLTNVFQRSASAHAKRTQDEMSPLAETPAAQKQKLHGGGRT